MQLTANGFVAWPVLRCLIYMQNYNRECASHADKESMAMRNKEVLALFPKK